MADEERAWQAPVIQDRGELPPGSASRKLRLLIPLVVAFAFFLEQLDATIITTAIPDMARGLGVTPLRLNLALTAYLLAQAVFIPISGWIADRFGMRRTFCAAIAVFTLGSIVCGAAPGFATLVAARVGQGFGGAMMLPVGRLILLRSFAREDLVTAMSYMSIPAVIGPTIGPLAGGFITTYASWRWIFYVNIPFGALGILLAWRYVQDVGRAPPRKFDFPGFALLALGMASLELTIENFGRGSVSTGTVLAMAGVAATVLLTYAWTARERPHAALDLWLLRVRSFRVALGVGGLCRIGINAVPFLLPLLFQIGFGMSAMQSGSLTFVSSLGAFAIRPLTGRMLRGFGFDRLLTGTATLAAGVIAGFALVRADTPHALLLPYILLYGILRSTQFNAIQTLTYSDIPTEDLSGATSLGGVVQQLTMGFGVSLSAAVLGLIAPSERALRVADFHTALLLTALVTLLSAPGFLLLAPNDGALVSGHRRGAA